jgi:deoxyribonuclease V
MSDLVCVDVQYGEKMARPAALTFAEWTDVTPAASYTTTLPTPHSYTPGRFFERELPCLWAVLELLPHIPHTIVIDGYVWLDHNRPGLGWHLYQALHQAIPVIGVAKTAFRGNNAAVPVWRGQSQQPLWVTAVGLPAGAAADHIRTMHGPHRLPTLLKQVDQLARTPSTQT